MKLARITYYEPWDWVIGASSYEDEFYKAEQAISGLSRQNFWMMLALAAATLLASAGGWFFISGRVNGQIEDVARTLRVASEQVTSASSEVSDSGQLMADSASGQAASLEEVNASLREIHAATQAGVQLATESDQAAGKARAAARSGVQAMGKMTGAIDDIKKSSEETARILKTIDEIAFQTNLLALNAAVEAARAGDAGKGFAVVAEEVRNLAGRSAEAAKNTAILIEESQANAGNGVVAATEVGGFLAEIADSVETVTGLVARMASTNKEQATALEEIASATEQLEGVTQGNAATAEETASASVELSQQARDVFQAVHCLNQIIKGGADSACREEKLSGSEPRTPRRPAAKRDNRPQPRPDQDQAQEVFSLEESETLEI
jgi:methyl-accepting chemotaxis protein